LRAALLRAATPQHCCAYPQFPQVYPHLVLGAHVTDRAFIGLPAP
jgi:hypothetical protein